MRVLEGPVICREVVGGQVTGSPAKPLEHHTRLIMRHYSVMYRTRRMACRQVAHDLNTAIS